MATMKKFLVVALSTVLFSLSPRGGSAFVARTKAASSRENQREPEVPSWAGTRSSTGKKTGRLEVNLEALHRKRERNLRRHAAAKPLLVRGGGGDRDLQTAYCSSADIQESLMQDASNPLSEHYSYFLAGDGETSPSFISCAPSEEMCPYVIYNVSSTNDDGATVSSSSSTATSNNNGGGDDGDAASSPPITIMKPCIRCVFIYAEFSRPMCSNYSCDDYRCVPPGVDDEDSGEGERLLQGIGSDTDPPLPGSTPPCVFNPFTGKTECPESDPPATIAPTKKETSSSVIEITSGQTVQIDRESVEEEYFVMTVPAGFSATCTTLPPLPSLYVKFDSLPSPTDYDERGYDGVVGPTTPLPMERSMYLAGYFPVTGFDHVYLQCTVASSAAPTAAPTPALAELFPGVTVRLDLDAGEESNFFMDVPGTLSATCFTSGENGDVDLLIQFGSVPSGTEYDYGSSGSFSTERVGPTSASANDRTLYINVHAHSQSTQVYLQCLLEVPPTEAPTTPPAELSSGQPVSISLSSEEELYFLLAVPANHTVNCTISDEDATMYTKFGGLPSRWDYDLQSSSNYDAAVIGPTSPTSEEQTMYLMVYASWLSIDGAVLECTVGLPPPPAELLSGQAVSISLSSGEELYFLLAVSANHTVTCTISDDDATLYTKLDGLPSTWDYDFSSRTNDFSSVLGPTSPTSEDQTMYLMVYAGWSIYSATLECTIELPPSPAALSSGQAVSINLSSDDKLYFLLAVPANHTVNCTISDEDATMYTKFGGLPSTWDYDLQSSSDLDSAVIGPTSPTSEEQTMYLMVYASWLSISGAVLECTVDLPPPPPPPMELVSGQQVSLNFDSFGDTHEYYIAIPSGSVATCYISPTYESAVGSDVDLYANLGSPVTDNFNYDYSSVSSGSEEVVGPTSPSLQDTELYVRAKLYSGTAQVNLWCDLETTPETSTISTSSPAGGSEKVKVCMEQKRVDYFAVTELRDGRYYGCSYKTALKHFKHEWTEGVKNARETLFIIGDAGTLDREDDGDDMLDVCTYKVDGIACRSCTLCPPGNQNLDGFEVDCSNIVEDAVTVCGSLFDRIEEKLLLLQDGYTPPDPTPAPTSTPTPAPTPAKENDVPQQDFSSAGILSGGTVTIKATTTSLCMVPLILLMAIQFT